MKEITDVKFLYWDNPEAFPSWGDFTFNLGDKRIYFLYDDFNFYYSYKGYGEKKLCDKPWNRFDVNNPPVEVLCDFMFGEKYNNYIKDVINRSL